GNEAAITDFLRSTSTAELTKACLLASDHVLEQRRPLLSRRRSPNRPNDSVSHSMATPQRELKCHAQNHAPTAPRHTYLLSESRCSTKMCACRSAFAGTTA